MILVVQISVYVCVCTCVMWVYLCCVRRLNHSERLFDSQMYLHFKSLTSDALIILLCADKQAAGKTVPKKNGWMIKLLYKPDFTVVIVLLRYYGDMKEMFCLLLWRLIKVVNVRVIFHLD